MKNDEEFQLPSQDNGDHISYIAPTDIGDDSRASSQELLMDEMPSSSPSSSSCFWVPPISAFLLALLAISPWLFWIFLKMKVMAVPYIFLHLTSIPLAFHLRDRKGWVRWLSAFLIVAIMGQIKTFTIISSFDGESIVQKGIFYALTALWECSNAVYIFGGKSLLDRFGISSYRQALFAVTCPVQIKFIDSSHYPTDKLLHRTLHIGLYIGVFFLLRLLFGFGVDFIEEYAILEAEALVILFSCLVNLWNVPPLLYQLMLKNYPVQVIYPYGSVYFSTSSRAFWSKWSRPASSLIRHMFYYPLGGSRRAWLSVPLMFLLNASSHFSLSEALVGSKAEVGWVATFGVLGLGVLVEILGNQFFGHTIPESGLRVVPKWWDGICFITAMATLRFGAYTLLHKCLNESLSSLVK